LCEKLAETAGVNNSHGGKRVEKEAYRLALQACLNSRGWLRVGAGGDPAEISVPARLIEKDDSGHLIFDRSTIILPPGARIITRTMTSAGPVIMEVIDVEGEIQGLTYSGRIIAQKIFTRDLFQPVLDRGHEPYFTYAAGKTSRDLPWRAFAFNKEKSWHGSVEFCWNIARHKRVIVTLTMLLPPQTSPPPPRCRLNLEQGRALDNLLTAIRPWLETFEPPERRFSFFDSD